MTSGRYKKRELAYWGVDYIKAVVEVPESSVLNGLSANSNQIFLEYEGTSIDITLEDNGAFFRYYVIRAKGVSIAFAGKGSNTGRPPFLEVTGQALTIFGVGIFYYLMEQFGLEFVKYKRFDVCFDMFLDINYFSEKILEPEKKLEKNYSELRSKRNGLETMYFGNRNIKQNSYILIRIYNKVLDSVKKGKGFLYEDAYKDENGKWRPVTRFECEMREDVAKFWKYEDLKNDKFLYWRLVKSFWKMNVQFFKFLKDAEFYEFSKEYNAKRKKNLASIFSDKKSASPMSMSQARLIKSLEREEHQTKYGSDFTSDADRVQCVSSFQSFGKRLFKNGYSREKIIELLDISCNFEEKTSI